VEELYRQANSAGSGDSKGLIAVQSQIDALNHQLELVWQQDSASGIDMLTTMQTLEEQARTMQRELQNKTRALEELIWDIDDRLNVFYRGQQSGGNEVQIQYEAEMALIQQRRIDIEEQRWAIEIEQRSVFEEIEAGQAAAVAEIKAIENGEGRELKNQIRTLELELRGFFATQRELEIKMDAARGLVEDKKRELEDNVLDLLEGAAGVDGGDLTGSVTEGDTTETEVGPDGTLPELDEVVEPDPAAIATE
jgi:hypothetical protein